MERLQLKLLGGFEARTVSGREIGLGGRKAEALLAYLALQPGKRHGREKLADLLWSGLGDEHGRNSLRKALTALRKALAEIQPELLLADRDMVALDPAAVEVDVVEFQELMAEGAAEQLERGAALYGGELLEGFSLKDPVFEDWLEGERRRLHDVVVRALHRLLVHRAEQGEQEQAIAVAEHLLMLDPLQESVHGTLMRLHAESGQREAALKQYQICRELLERELGVEPEPETVELFKAIREARLASRNSSQAAEAGPSAAGEASAPEQAPLGGPTQSPSRVSAGWRWLALSAALLFVVAGGLATWFHIRAPKVEPALEANMAFPLPDKPSIAVLPFVNLGDDPQQDYFADGMTEDLITDLAKIDGLFVMARNSVFTYKSKPVTVKQVAEDLGVRYVLEGSVRRRGDQVRINAQLVDALSGFHLWAERFDGSIGNVFALQDEVSQNIVTALAVNLSSQEDAQIAQVQTDNPEAYDAFLRGWGIASKWSADSMVKAIPYLEKAIELDPNYGRAYAALAYVYSAIFRSGWQKQVDLTQKELMDLTTHYLGLALKKPTPLAYFVANAVHYVRGEYEEAIGAAERAIALGAKNPLSYLTMAKALLYAGRINEALESLEKAVRLDPLNPDYYFWRRGQVLYHLGRFEDSASQFRLLLDSGENYTDIHMFLAANYGQLERTEEAKGEIQQIRTMEKDEGWSYSVLSVDSWSYQLEENREQFREGLRKAGMEEIPWGYDLNSPNMVRGEDIRSLYFGRTIKGTDAQSGKERIISITEDGQVTSRIGELVDTGVVDGGHDEKLCIRWEGEGRVCVVTFRNPEGTPEQLNEYDYVYFGGVIPFSQLD